MQAGINQEVLLHRMTNRIRQSLEIQEILTATVAEIRSFLGTDRVMVYRFHADSSGEVIAESIHENRLPSLLGLNFPADDIPLRARELLLTARQRSIVNVSTKQIGLSQLNSPLTGEPIEREDINYRSVDPCHLEYLTAMGVKSSLVVPILHDDITSQQPQTQLWGLLVSHHAEPYSITEQELELVQLVADQVSIAIAQSCLLNQARDKAAREATINQVATLLHTLPTIHLQAALEETVKVLQGSGGRLYITPPHQSTRLETPGYPQVYICGVQPSLVNQGESQQNISTSSPVLFDFIEESSGWQSANISTSSGGVQAIADLYQQAQFQSLLPAFAATHIRGLLIVPLEYRQQFLGYLSIFRDEIDTERLWAGRFDSDQRQLYPRLSFEAWRELKKGLAREWMPEDLELAKAIGNHFAMAVQQYQLYQQVQLLNTDLECKVQKRTSQLQQALDFSRTFSHLLDKIRRTLDSKTILQAIVQEVQKLLDTDRVVIYQFREEWHGKVVVESTKGDWPSILGLNGPGDCFPREVAQLYETGRVRAIDNIATANLSPCHQEFLQSIQVQANLLVPIRMGEKLWGLLVAHQCHAPRVWQETEIDFLQQLADQAAIALQQAELYEQSQIAARQEQAKAQQLEAALDELQRTQSQLIQTEKMSSLGQLVAGVAHEINNPVNFIYGNLIHADQYTQDLLELLNLYQQYYPNPHPDICDLAEEIELDFLCKDLPKLLASVKVGSERIRQLVLSLRNFSRLEESDRKAVDLHEGLESTLLILQHRFKSKTGQTGIQLIKDYGNLPLVECYAGLLNQVFMNLIANAVDALEQNQIAESNESRLIYSSIRGNDQRLLPTIQIRTELCDSNNVRIRIADNGPGIPAKVISRIFDPFFTTKPLGKGTGLGLAISYQIIVDRHGGILNCLSQPGEGTEFMIEIPIKVSGGLEAIKTKERGWG